MNYFNPSYTDRDINRISTLGLAYIGDCVFEMLVRMWLISEGHTASHDLHHTAVHYVNATAQHAFFDRICGILFEEELAVYHRGRNAKVNSVPQHSSVSDYHAATGLEALFGWLYLKSDLERINTLFDAGIKKEI